MLFVRKSIYHSMTHTQKKEDEKKGETTDGSEKNENKISKETTQFNRTLHTQLRLICAMNVTDVIK